MQQKQVVSIFPKILVISFPISFMSYMHKIFKIFNNLISGTYRNSKFLSGTKLIYFLNQGLAEESQIGLPIQIQTLIEWIPILIREIFKINLSPNPHSIFLELKNRSLSQSKKFGIETGIQGLTPVPN